MRVARDYQTDIIERTEAALQRSNWVICQSPTGSGKSFIMLLMTQKGLQDGQTFLVLTESKKIFTQLSNEFGAVRINSKTNYFVLRPGNVYVAMSQSLANRAKIIDKFLELGDKLTVMIDEAHVGTTRKVIEVFPGKRIGFTATPAYRWAKFLPDLYNELVPGLQVEELISKGALSPYDHKGRKKIDGSVLEKNSTGEYTEASQEKAFSTSKVYDGLYEDLKKIPHKCGIIYVASIKQCDDVYKRLQDHGYNCAINHSKLTPEQQELEMLKFHDDPDCCLMVSVASLTKGYDNPIIDLVVLLRATTSLPLYLQMIGRGGRVLKDNDLIAYRLKKNCPELLEKKHFTCLDYGLNYDRFGAWDSDRDWQELWQATASRAAEAAPVKSCPSCESYLPTSARVCKWCGFEYGESEIVYQIGELVDFKSEEPENPFKGRMLGDLEPEELAQWAIQKNAKARAITVAMARRQQERWDEYETGIKVFNYLKEFGEAMGYNEKWYQVKTGEIIAYEKNAALNDETGAKESTKYFDPRKYPIRFHDSKLR